MISKGTRGCQVALGLLAVALTALAAATGASASSTPQAQWRSAGKFLPYGSAVGTKSTSSAGLDLYSVSGEGIPVWVTCSELEMTGSVENPVDEQSGLLFGSGGEATGPQGTWKNCLLVQYGTQFASENTSCHIPKELPAELGPGALEDIGVALRLRMKAGLAFTIECPELGIRAPWKFVLNGTAKELPGEQGKFYFPESTTKVENPIEGGSGEAAFGLGLASSAGPITVGEYIAPEATAGSHWFLGGARRSPSEGSARLIKEGVTTKLTGSAGTLTLESTQSGLVTKLSCSSSLQGSVENPAGAAPGVAHVKFVLGNCTFGTTSTKVKGCTVQEGGFTTEPLVGTVESPSSYPVLVTAPIGSKVGKFTVSGCNVSTLNHSYEITGKFNISAQMHGGNSPGAWRLLESLNRKAGILYVFGQLAGATGETTAEVGGEVVTMG